MFISSFDLIEKKDWIRNIGKVIYGKESLNKKEFKFIHF
jgi:hypothetical protein